MRRNIQTFDASVELVPLTGKSTIKTVTVTAQTTMREIAERAGVENPGLRNLYVDDKPATFDTLVTSISRIKITERPQGS